MNIKNLKLNSKKLKALLGAVIITTNLSSCGYRIVKDDPKESTNYISLEVTTLENTKEIVVNNKIISVEDIRLADKKTKKIIEKLDGVIIDNKIVNIDNPIMIKFTKGITSVLLNNEIIPLDEFILINIKDNSEITNINYIINNQELVEFKETEDKEETKEEETKEEVPEEVYEELTEEKFNELVEETYKMFQNEGIAVEKNNVRDFVLMSNLDKIAEDNKDIINKIIGNRNIDEVFGNGFMIISSVMTENNRRYCEGKPMNENISAEKIIFDKAERKKYSEIEKRLINISKIDSNEQFNDEINKILMDMLNSQSQLFTLEAGTGYNVTYFLMHYVRLNYSSRLNEQNKSLLKYFVSFAEDSVEEQQNSKSTAYYLELSDILNTCEKAKTKTK